MHQLSTCIYETHNKCEYEYIHIMCVCVCAMIKINSTFQGTLLFVSLLARTLEHRGKFQASSLADGGRVA